MALLYSICWPTSGSAEIDSPVVCSWMSDCRLLLVLICCSTSLNETSCCVNVLVSIGDSGSWFWSCVVSSVRNVLKFDVKLRALLLPLLVDPLVAVLAVIGGKVTGGRLGGADAHGAYTSMSSAPSWRRGRAAGVIGSRRLRPLGRARNRLRRRGILGEGLRVAAQVEAEAARIGLEAGVAQRLLQRR